MVSTIHPVRFGVLRPVASCVRCTRTDHRAEEPPPGAVVGGQGRVAQQAGEVPAAELCVCVVLWVGGCLDGRRGR